MSKQMKTLLSGVCLLLAIATGSCGGGAGTPPNPPDEVKKPRGGEFTLIVLPDTQCYTSLGAPLNPEACGTLEKRPFPDGDPGWMDMLNAEMDWVAKNQASMNIQAVLGVGDIVQCASEHSEWERADVAYDRLDAAGIRYVPVAGNLDYDVACGDQPLGSRQLANYNAYFGPDRLNAYAWYGKNSFSAGSNDNFFITFESGGVSYLVLALEFFPRDAVLAWAQSVIDAYPDRQVIITTHSFLIDPGPGLPGKRITDSDPGGPGKYGLTTDNNGEEIWEKFIRKNKNIIAVVNGHTGGAANRVDAGDHGNRVAQMIANYQFSGGRGYLRILKFKPANGVIDVQTYSPYFDRFRNEPDDQFTIPYGLP
jgi:hypothetical protein